MKQGWEIKKLGEVFETSSGGTPSKNHNEYYEGGNIPWLRSGEISKGLIYDAELRITEQGLNNSSAKIFPINTVVIAMYGATVGQVGVLKKAMATNQAICAILPTPNFSSMFLRYYLKAIKSYFLSVAAGGAQPNISQYIIQNTKIPIPPLAEQERIVAELDCLSGVIEKKKQQVKELDALAQSIFYEMFGDPVKNNKGWDLKGWKDVFDTKTGRLNANAMVENGKYPFFTCSKEMYRINTYSFDCEALLLSGNNATANYDVKYYKGKFNAYQRTYILTLKDNSSYIFFKYALENQLCLLQKQSIGGLTKYLTLGILNIISFIVPPLSLQQAFASKIEAIEKQKELIKQSIKEVETLFNSRMDYYFN